MPLLFVVILSLFLFYHFWFLRKPQRFPIGKEGYFVSPASGTVIAVLRTEGDFLPILKKHHIALEAFTKDVGKQVTMVSIMMTPMDVHFQRAPHDATVLDVSHTPGKFLNAVQDAQDLKATLENEHTQILCETPDGIRFKVIQIAGFVARRIIPFVAQHDVVSQGDEIGVIKFGSQVTILFDEQVEILCQVGQYMTDGETLIAKKIL